MRYLESTIQQGLIRWARLMVISKKFPELALLYSIPNGGARTGREAARLSREGVRPGVPDLCLPCARKGFYGLYLETKSPEGQITKPQEEYALLLQWQNYKHMVYRSIDSGIAILTGYLGDD